jgi:hexosaminidase
MKLERPGPMTKPIPYTIPALKSWIGGETAYTFGVSTRIVLQSAHLAGSGVVFADDLQALSGLDIPVLTGERCRAGDIFLTLGERDDELGDQGYRLEVNEQVTISAHTDDGVFNGTRTLLQLLKQSLTVPGGVARDWPDYPQRSLMVDVGRQYFSVPWLERHFRDLAYLKYNFFHFHFSDNFGFRLQSERHPETVSEQHYSKAEMRALIELARKYHITLVPEIDVPGHLDAALAAHPELLLANSAGKRQTGDLDLANAAAYDFVRDLLEEYIPLFPGPYWHLGADEYLLHNGNYEDYPQLEAEAKRRYGPQATGKDLYLGFVNWAHEIVKAHGKITRVWSDGQYGGSAVTPAADNIVYEHWVSWGPSPRQIVERGIPIVNANLFYLYYVPGSPFMQARANALYDDFEPHLFCLEFGRLDDVEGVNVPESAASSAEDFDLLKHHPLNLGAKLHIWCDDPTAETEEQIAVAIEHSLRALAQKNWGSPRLVGSYEEFKPIIAAIGHAPAS